MQKIKLLPEKCTHCPARLWTRSCQWIFILSLALGLSVTNAHAQSDSIVDAYITMETSTTNNNILEGTFVVILNDTTGIANIEVKIGTSTALSDVMSHTFVFDSQAGLPSGFSYSRAGKKVTLGIGTYVDKSTFFGEARLQLSNGSWTQPLQFITN